MLISSTYRVVLHPSFLQKVFSLIIFIKERYSFTILSEKWLSGGVPWAKLKSYGHLSADRQQNRDIWCRWSFIAGTAPSFSIKRCANPASNWASFIKRSSTSTLEKLRCCPGKTNCIHCLMLGSSGSWTRLSFPHNQKHTSLETFFLSEPSPVQCSRMERVEANF